MVTRTALMLLSTAAASINGGRTAKPAPPPAAAAHCATAGPSSDGQLAYAKHLGTSNDTSWANRRSAFKIPKVSTSQIYVVTTESICAQAVAAFNAFYKGSPPTTRAFVIRFGTYYWVDDPDLSTGNDGRPWVLFTRVG